MPSDSGALWRTHVARSCAIAAVVAALAFAAWQWVTPPGFVSVRGLNPGALAAWRGAFGFAPRVASASPGLIFYAALFRVLLLVAFAAYGGLWWCVWRSRPNEQELFSARWTWPLAAPLVVLLAVLQPASLSTDVFAYVGYARLPVVHGLNPYLHTQAELVTLADPTAGYLRWPIASPYGPLWTLLCMGLIALAPAGAVWGPVVALKLVAGGGLLAAAGFARAWARRSDPARANGVFLLVVLNPLLLIEGPGNGHNDLIMVALLLAGLWALSLSRARTAASLVGLSIAVKMVPVMVAPWLALLAARATPSPWYRRAGVALLVTMLALAPVVLAYGPFWNGGRTLDGLRARFRHGDNVPTSTKSSRTPPRTAVPAASSGSAATAATATGAPAVTATAVTTATAATVRSWLHGVLGRVWPALLIWWWGGLAVAFGRGDAAPRLLTIWCLLALAMMLFVAGLWFPWYLAWLWPALVVRFTRLHMALTAFALPFSLLLMLAYAMPPG